MIKRQRCGVYGSEELVDVTFIDIGSYIEIMVKEVWDPNIKFLAKDGKFPGGV